MGDIWPYGKPRYATWDQCFNAISNAGGNSTLAAIMAAIATAESGLDWMVVNDTAATGDYSVGLWQINYYGSLYAGRVSEFGTPKHLADSGVAGQAKAALRIANSQGLSAWSTYTDGAYTAYLHGAKPVPGQVAGREGLPNHDVNPPTEDYSATIRQAANAHRGTAARLVVATTALRNLKDGNPNG